jgi:DNA-binding XRE family transcriptional regulator
MPNTRSHYDRRPGRYAIQKKEFQRLIAKLKRLALKKGYSQAQIASEVGVSIITVNNWLTGHSLNGAAQENRSTEEVFGCSLMRTFYQPRERHEFCSHHFSACQMTSLSSEPAKCCRSRSLDLS